MTDYHESADSALRAAYSRQPEDAFGLPLTRPPAHRSWARRRLGSFAVLKHAYVWAVRAWRFHTVARHRVLSLPSVEWLATCTSRRILHCFGDSHVLAFRHIGRNSDLLRRTWFDVVAVRGATASGLSNPNSRTDALNMYRRSISRLTHDSWLLFLLGEVDCGYLLWLKAGESRDGLSAQLDRSIAHYTGFLDQVIGDGYHHVIVATVPLPTIVDYTTWSGLQGARAKVTASISERTELTRAFNQKIRAWSEAHGTILLDYENEVLDQSTGLVRNDLLNPMVLNHHLNPVRFSEILAAKLQTLGFT